MNNTGFGFEQYLRLGFEPSVSTLKQLTPLWRFLRVAIAGAFGVGGF